MNGGGVVGGEGVPVAEGDPGMRGRAGPGLDTRPSKSMKSKVVGSKDIHQVNAKVAVAT